MMQVQRVSEIREIIQKHILSMEKPFHISDLFHQLAKKNVTDRSLILEVLDQLLDCGLVNFAEMVDDLAVYQSSFFPTSA